MKNKLTASPFTPALSKAFKSHKAKLICSMTDGAAYVTNGAILVKLTPEEYDEFIRPISQRDPGAWVLDENGQPMERETLDGARVLNDYANKATVDMAPAPFTINPERKSGPAFSVYCGAGDFVAGFDAGYTAIVSPSFVTFRASSAISGMVAFNGEDPIALILPVRLQNPKIISAARAYFTDGQPKEQTEPNDHAAELAAALEDAAKLREELAQTKAQLEAAQAAPAPQPKPEEQPADKLEAVISALQTLPGISATVKGAQTAAPVVWIDGDAETHKAELEKLGAKWSGKRSAYYVQVKAA